MQQPPNQWQPMPQQPGWQQPMYQPPPKKKSRKGLWIGLGMIVLAIVLCGVIASSLAKSSPSTDTTSVATTSTGQQATQPANTPAHAARWTTTHTFSGNGIKKTETFSVPDDWKILWSCTAGNNVGVDGVLTVAVYSGTTPIDAAVNATCKDGSKTSDSTEEHQGGSVYLDINATGDWSIQIQELK